MPNDTVPFNWWKFRNQHLRWRALDVAFALDQVVDDVVIDRFDHKHLNLDLDDFNDRVPSVENIAARCVDLLRDPVAAIPGDCRLHGVKVWETPRTACTVLA